MKGESSERLFMYILVREADILDHTTTNSSDPVIIPKLNVVRWEESRMGDVLICPLVESNLFSIIITIFALMCNGNI